MWPAGGMEENIFNSLCCFIFKKELAKVTELDQAQYSDTSPAKQTVMHTVHGAHAQVDEPFWFGRSLLALKVDELSIVPLQDEVKVLPSFAFA